jgi:hypothetical protein
MIGSTGERLQQFIARDEKPKWWDLCGTFVFLFIALLVWMQTESYVKVVRTFSGPTYEQLRDHIAESRKIQSTLALKNGKTLVPGFTYLYVEEGDRRKLDTTRSLILDDGELRQKLQEQFGTNLDSVGALVTLTWETDNPGYCEQIGITRQGGWIDFKEATKSCAIGATTIRDRPYVTQRTLDGTPRIVLNPNALAYSNWTRFVVFHEMMHAMNIPAYSPKFAWVQTDLTYLKEYRWYVDKNNLGTWNDYICWGFTLLFCTTSLVLFVRYLRYK